MKMFAMAVTPTESFKKNDLVFYVKEGKYHPVRVTKLIHGDGTLDYSVKILSEKEKEVQPRSASLVQMDRIYKQCLQCEGYLHLMVNSVTIVLDPTKQHFAAAWVMEQTNVEEEPKSEEFPPAGITPAVTTTTMSPSYPKKITLDDACKELYDGLDEASLLSLRRDGKYPPEQIDAAILKAEEKMNEQNK